jgi:hypothetical protein
MVLQTGDICFYCGDGLISKAIRRYHGDNTIVSHVGIMYDRNTICEALFNGTKFRPLKQKGLHQIWRYPDGPKNPSQIQKAARYYRNKPYGYAKILTHLADALIPWNPYFFRRLNFIDSMPICSWVVAQIYLRAEQLTFGVPPTRATPDDIHDFVIEKEWQCVYDKASNSFDDLGIIDFDPRDQ